jgi:hypothetical protein
MGQLLFLRARLSTGRLARIACAGPSLAADIGIGPLEAYSASSVWHSQVFKGDFAHSKRYLPSWTFSSACSRSRNRRWMLQPRVAKAAVKD